MVAPIIQFFTVVAEMWRMHPSIHPSSGANFLIFILSSLRGKRGKEGGRKGGLKPLPSKRNVKTGLILE